MDTIPPSWIFVGNKPSLNNITFVIANEEDASIHHYYVTLQFIPIFSMKLTPNP